MLHAGADTKQPITFSLSAQHLQAPGKTTSVVTNTSLNAFLEQLHFHKKGIGLSSKGSSEALWEKNSNNSTIVDVSGMM